MKLCKATLKRIFAQPGLTIPGEKVFDLPEKVLQFGTGVLLRGLPDYFIDKANREGLFNGRVVMIKSTTSGGTEDFEKQDCLYSLCVRGIEKEKKVDETIINSSISRVISANENWDSVLELAASPDMQIIISNTTEVGITLVQDDIRMYPPLSFPGKLLAFLHERYKAFNGSEESGMVIIPTELIPDNGDKLRSILMELAAMNRLDRPFIDWLAHSNHYCNSLVDRIVPGKLPDGDRFKTENKLGYTDELMIMAESFRLWAIATSNKKVEAILSFSKADEGVVIAPDIEKYRELKLRLLNGTHSFSCGLAWLAGFKTVREGMGNEQMSSFIHSLMMQEMVPAICDEKISLREAEAFATQTLDRFRNPFLDHQWLSICAQYSSKMKMRNVDVLLRHYSKSSQVPELMALGFAAFLLFMKPGHPARDDHDAWFAEKWQLQDTAAVVNAVLSARSFWETDLSVLPGFAAAVKINLDNLIENGAVATLRRIQLKNTVAG